MPFKESKREAVKLIFDSFKHLTTLCTGSLVILATFLKDLFPSPEWRLLASFSLVFFLLSIISAIFILMTLTKVMGEEGIKGDAIKKMLGINAFISLGLFILAITCLIVFSIKNLG